MKWLTPEQAVEEAELSISVNSLSSYPTRSQQKITTEERFRKLGLLFSRKRYEAGRPYLALLNEELETTKTSSSALDDEVLAASSQETGLTDDCVDSCNKASCASLSLKDPKSLAEPVSQEQEPYVFEQCKIKLTITFLPSDNSPLGREVILAVSSHSDFPVNKILRLQELGELPAPITSLLNELETDFPNRKTRRILAGTRTKKNTKEIDSLSTQSDSPSIVQEVEQHNRKQLPLSFL